MGLIDKYDGFDWDAGNIRKNWDGHHVTIEEIEQVFSNFPGSITRQPVTSELKKEESF
jgi:uncharacterized DUF497 family protein